jgi:hypothetical protein
MSNTGNPRVPPAKPQGGTVNEGSANSGSSTATVIDVQPSNVVTTSAASIGTDNTTTTHSYVAAAAQANSHTDVREGVPRGEARGVPPLVARTASPDGKNPPNHFLPQPVNPHPAVAAPAGATAAPVAAPAIAGYDNLTTTVTPDRFVRRQSLADKHLERARAIDERLKSKAIRIVESAAKAAYLDDDGLPVDGTKLSAKGVPEGWSPVAYNVAKDARKPLKQQPGYLSMMQRVLDSYKRAEAEHRPAPELGADIRVYLTQNVFQYPTRDVTDEPK